jgi:hypothetical protein
MARLFGSSIFNFLRKFHDVFYSGCTNLPSQEHLVRVSLSPCSYQHLFFWSFNNSQPYWDEEIPHCDFDL